MTDEQYFTELYKSGVNKLVHIKQQYIDWIYKNYHICNGQMLVERMEDMQTQEAFIKDAGLPDDVELM